MPEVEYEIRAPVFEDTKTIHALHHVATLIGKTAFTWIIVSQWLPFTIGTRTCSLYRHVLTGSEISFKLLTNDYATLREAR
jgi:hypothetical protein